MGVPIDDFNPELYQRSLDVCRRILKDSANNMERI